MLSLVDALYQCGKAGLKVNIECFLPISVTVVSSDLLHLFQLLIIEEQFVNVARLS
jgi:hypothetical protein